MTYRNEIDGVRAIAVVSVIISHAGFAWLPGGFAGVDVFFVISGFLITGIILRDLELGKFTFRDFYARRARRIFPALFFMLSAVSVYAWLFMSPSQIQDLSASVFFSVLFLSNFFFIDFVDYFAPAAELIPLLHTWSLGIEEQFYILFPMIGLLTFRLARRPGFWAIIVVLLFTSFALSEWGWRNEPRGNYFFSPSRFWEILLGSVAALWCAGRKNKGNSTLAALGLCALCLSFFIYDDATLFPSYHTLLPTMGTALVLIYARGANFTARVLQLPPLRFVGLISFSAYLWHQPVFVFARIEGYETSEPATAFLLIAGILGLSTATWYFVEQPFRIPSVAFSRLRAPVLWGGATALIALSVVGYFTSLPMMRFNAADQKLLATTRIEASSYQRSIGRPYERRTFTSNDARPKVAIIGDSFGRDLMNVLNERQILENLDASFWVISHICAPFFLHSRDEQLRHIWDSVECAQYDRYSSPEVMKAITTADVVVLASNWSAWQVPYIVETIENIQKASKASIVLAGPKSFGRVSTQRLLRLSVAERPKFRTRLSTDIVDTNEALKQIEGIVYLDLVGAICDPDGGCPQVTKDGRLISEDGNHLTRAGAIFLGASLDQKNELRSQFGMSETEN